MYTVYVDPISGHSLSGHAACLSANSLYIALLAWMVKYWMDFELFNLESGYMLEHIVHWECIMPNNVDQFTEAPAQHGWSTGSLIGSAWHILTAVHYVCQHRFSSVSFPICFGPVLFSSDLLTSLLAVACWFWHALASLQNISRNTCTLASTVWFWCPSWP